METIARLQFLALVLQNFLLCFTAAIRSRELQQDIWGGASREQKESRRIPNLRAVAFEENRLLQADVLQPLVSLPKERLPKLPENPFGFTQGTRAIKFYLV